MELDKKHGVLITERDRLMSAWLRSMETVRDYERFAKELGGTELGKTFAEFAEEIGVQSSKLRELLLQKEP